MPREGLVPSPEGRHLAAKAAIAAGLAITVFGFRTHHEGSTDETRAAAMIESPNSLINAEAEAGPGGEMPLKFKDDKYSFAAGNPLHKVHQVTREETPIVLGPSGDLEPLQSPDKKLGTMEMGVGAVVAVPGLVSTLRARRNHAQRGGLTYPAQSAAAPAPLAAAPADVPAVSPRSLDTLLSDFAEVADPEVRARQWLTSVVGNSVAQEFRDIRQAGTAKEEELNNLVTAAQKAQEELAKHNNDTAVKEKAIRDHSKIDVDALLAAYEHHRGSNGAAQNGARYDSD